MTARRLLLALTVAAGLAGCSAGGPAPSGLGLRATQSSAASFVASVPASSTTRTPPTKVLLVVEENHDRDSALAGMPTLAALARRYGLATGYHGVTHPSLPNYLAMIGGQTFGVRDDASPRRHPLHGPSVLDEALAAHRSARAYLEGMPRPCGQAATTRYAVKHNPWAYFADAGPRAACRAHEVDSGSPQEGALHDDVTAGRLPTLGLLVPDICHDGHDCTLGTADNWLRDWLRVVLDGPDWRAGRLAVLVTFDEDDQSHGNTVALVVLSPTTSHVRVARRLDHLSLARYLAEVAGVRPPGASRRAPSLRPLFHL